LRPLGARRAAALLSAMRRRRVLVVGDVMLDEFLWGRVSRISPEAPVPVVEVVRQSFHLGGAGNVAANVRSLGGRATLVSAIGDDAGGAHVREAVERAGVDSRLVVSPGRPTTVKTRIVAHQQQVVRADREDRSDMDAGTGAAILDALREELGRCDVLVISDYQKGVVTAAALKRLLPLAQHVPVLVDPKLGHFRLYRGVTVVTPNQLEAEQATGVRLRDGAELATAGARILRMLRCRAALVTRGERGMSLFEQGKPPLHVPTAAREVFDVTGAGDTVIATMSLALAAGASLPEAAVLANAAAGVVVGKLGTAQATPDEVLASLRAASTRA
jgi:D-beta-D-heptose 7-phosphate kinase/D-beta-D-heptose 1-phosphate adenosyltransferase